MITRTVTWLCLLLLLAQSGAAGDEPTTPADVARLVAEAYDRGDAARIPPLAQVPGIDPWLVVDVLLVRRQAEAASVYARAAPGRDNRDLPAYVEKHAGSSGPDGARLEFLKAGAAADRGELGRARALLLAMATPPEELLRCQQAWLRALVEAGLGNMQESYEVALDGGRVAEGVGWLAGASFLYQQAMSSAYDRSDWRACLAAAEARLAVERERQLPYEILAASGDVAFVLTYLGEHDRSIALGEEVLRDARAMGAADVEANTLTNLGMAYLDRQDYPRAIELSTEALALLRRLEDEEGVAGVLGNLADAYAFVADLDAAERCANEAIGLAERYEAPTIRRNALMVLGNVAESRGAYAEAIARYEQVRDAAHGVGDLEAEAMALGNIGQVYFRIARYEDAIRMGEAVLTLSAASPNVTLRINALMTIGNAWDALGETGQARERYEEALAAARAAGTEIAVLALEGNLIGLLLSEDRFDEAVTAGRALLEEVRDLDRPDILANTLLNLGQAECALGRPDPARSHALEALDTADANALLEPQVYARQLLAGLALAAGKPREAQREVEAAREAVDLLAQGLSEEGGVSARARWRQLGELDLRAALAQGDAAAVFRALERARGRALVAALGTREALRAAVLPPALARTERESEAQEVAAWRALQRALAEGRRESVRAARSRWTAARDGHQAVVERIQREARRGADVLHFRAADLEDVRRALPPTATLVLYALPEGDAVACVVEAGGVRVVPLAKTEAIRGACAALHPEDPATDVGATTDGLRELLIDPLALAPDARQVLICPDGDLAYVPFSLLLPDRDLALVTSATTWLLLETESAKRGEKVLGLGDPRYAVPDDAAPATMGVTALPSRLAALPATRAEVEAIADVRLLGGDATEAGLRRALEERGRWRAVHLACHGLIETDRPMLSALALTPDGRDDGLLTALDVYGLHLDADLAVLSACETARGRVVAGEGILGLTRAFMYAGAPRVLCSLWKVDDEATRALMTRFYQLWNPRPEPGAASGPGGSETRPGLPAAEALRLAQEHVRTHPDHPAWAHPYYWAAWELWGTPL